MGSRASYVIIEDGKKQYFYHHWGAQCLPEDIFWGVEPTLAFIQSLEKVEGLLDDVWCEGAVVVDCDTRQLLLFGGEDIAFENALRRVFLALLKINWPDWQVAWAKHKIYSLAQFLGDDLTDLIKQTLANTSTTLTDSDVKKSIQYDGSLVSMKQAGEVSHLPMDYSADDVLSQGEAFLPTLAPYMLGHAMMKPKEGEYSSCLFVDLDNTTISYSNTYSEDHRRHGVLAAMWPDWQMVEHSQGMYHHAQLCGLAWQDCVADCDGLLVALRETLLGTSDFNPQDTLNILQDNGFAVEAVASSFFQTDAANVDLARKKAIFDQAVKQWQSEDHHFENALKCEIWSDI